ncbi:MAG TPA: hypothetical protein VGL70_18550 [Candidatus Binatia bacterium]|jgi:hypothetical protein
MAKAKKIPGGITAEDFIRIRDCLREILKEAGAKQANLRLNESAEEGPHPFFVGWVGDKDVEKKIRDRNDPDPGLYRFGDDNYATVYKDTISDRRWAIQNRDWCRNLAEKSMTAKGIAPKSGVMYQKFIGILVKNGSKRRCVGTLALGFASRPSGRTHSKVEKIMKSWARDPRLKLVQFLRDNFELGGPISSR